MTTPLSRFYSPIVILSLFSVVLGVLFDVFFRDKALGIGFPLYILLAIAGFFVLLRISKKSAPPSTLWLLLPLFFFSSMVFLRASLLLTFLNVIASLFLLFVIAETSFAAKIRQFLLQDFLKVLLVPFSFLKPLSQTLGHLFSSFPRGRVVSRVFQGILLALPFLVIFILLFSSADFFFQKYAWNLLSLHMNVEGVSHIILIVLATLFWIGAYAYTLQDPQPHPPSSIPPQENTKRRFGVIESSIVLGSVNLLFFLFILSQLSYFFIDEDTILATGVTYAEYARQGFFQLIVVAIISLILLLATERFVPKRTSGHLFGFKALSTILVVQVVCIMVSAFIRLSLYESAYGFTTLRLYSHVFILFLAAVFGLVLYKIYRDSREQTFALRFFIAALAFLVVMNVLNPDSFIARKNLQRYAEIGSLDTVYLLNLSDDAMPSIIQLLDTPDAAVRDEVGARLALRASFLEFEFPFSRPASYYAHWESFHLSRRRASILLDRELPRHNLSPVSSFFPD